MSKYNKSYLINYEIKANKVRIIGDNIEPRICNIKEAISIAESMEMDLVEINSNSEPPICRIVRYDKFLYEEKRKQRDVEKRNRENRIEVKEIQLSPNIDIHDVEFKSKHAIKFLKENNKVKLVVKFGGREIMFKERGEKLLLEFVQNLESFGVPEYLPKLEGKRMHLILKPKKQ
jgi:translation initiation factor IF-3